ncbi:MAG TPA: hypothetical protein VMB22_07855 [Verrucomicrobiae bacterium]|nr:hypothetical protein [Verrucomicrobiae bacterium]
MSSAREPRFVSFLLPFIDRGQGPIYFWIMQLQAALLGPQRVEFIADEPYFETPPDWGQERTTCGHRYRGVTCEEWAAFTKHCLPRAIFAVLENRSRSMLEAFRVLLTKDYTPLREALEKILAEACRTRKPDAIISWCHAPSLKLAAAKFGIPVIHNELGPLRAPLYRGTVYFDFKGVNGFTSAEEQMAQFAREAAGWKNFQPLNLSELRELLIVTPEKRTASATVPTYQAGAALQVEDDSNLLAFANGLSNFELIFAARKGFTPRQILIRRHPGGHLTYSDKLGDLDCSADAIEFLSRCEQVFTVNSSIAFECLLQERPVTILGDSPAAALSRERIAALSPEERLLRLNWLFLGYLVPATQLFDADYYRWRLTNPSLREIYERHLAEHRQSPAPAPPQNPPANKPGREALLKELPKFWMFNSSNRDAGKKLAAALLDQQLIPEASRVLNHLIKINPADADTLCALAGCLVAEKNVEAAVENYRRVLRLDPANATARQAINLLAANTGASHPRNGSKVKAMTPVLAK